MNSSWSHDIDAVTEAFRGNFALLSEQEFNWKPRPDVWSVAQNMDHLIVINKTYYPVIERVRAGTYKLPPHASWGWLVRWFGNIILNSVAPDRKKKMKTFPLWQPSQSHLPLSLITDFEKHQAELKKMMSSCSDLIQAGTVISSPANRSIVYTLKTAFDIIVTHEKRHLLQAIETNQQRLTALT